MPNRQLYTRHTYAETSKIALFAYKLLIEYSIDIIVLKDWSVSSFVTPVGQEKYYVFLICIQDKNFNFQEKSQ